MMSHQTMPKHVNTAIGHSDKKGKNLEAKSKLSKRQKFRKPLIRLFPIIHLRLLPTSQSTKDTRTSTLIKASFSINATAPHK
jgi:hypothetical protein